MSQTTAVVQMARRGAALVDANRLQGVVKEMTDDVITLESDPETSTLHVRGARAHFKLLAMKPSDFPPFPAAQEATPFDAPAHALRRLVNQTSFASSREEGRYAKAGVLFQVGDGRLELVATDARRLSRAKHGIEDAGAKGRSRVPGTLARMLTPMLAEANKDEAVSICLGDRQAVFRMEGTTIATGLLEVEFPGPAGTSSDFTSCGQLAGTSHPEPFRIAGDE